MSLQVIVNFEVIAEAESWIVVNKPAPLIVHPANRKPEPTLLGGLEQLLSYEIRNGAVLAIVNRLDRETSGLVMVAKSTAAARELGMIFERREVSKEYLAIVKGWPEWDQWVCEEPILRAGELGPSDIWVRQRVHCEGKACRTSFRVENRFYRDGQAFSLLRCFPETGRMHQIRVHLAHGGFPIVGDKLYSGTGEEYLLWMEQGWTEALEKRLILPRHALHAAKLSLPWDGKICTWEAPLAWDLQQFIRGEVITSSPDVVIWSRHD